MSQGGGKLGLNEVQTSPIPHPGSDLMEGVPLLRGGSQGPRNTLGPPSSLPRVGPGVPPAMGGCPQLQQERAREPPNVWRFKLLARSPPPPFNEVWGMPHN